MRHYSRVVHSEEEYEHAWKQLVAYGFEIAGWGKDYARYILGDKEVKVIRVY